MPPPEPSHEKRILPVDGLRAIAVMGVIWAHLWSFGFGAPALPLGRLGPLTIDLNRLMSFWGTGVDLFFVISGLCMHLVYTSKPDALQIDRLVAFVKKRWLRIAPAYYAAVVACAIIVGATSKISWGAVFAHFAFVNGTIPGTNVLAPPFWSLAVEWQFYLILPCLVALVGRLGFWRATSLCVFLSMALRVWIFTRAPENQDYWTYQLPPRLMEFLWGVMVGQLYLSNTQPPRWLRNGIGALLALAVAFAGRLLMMTEVVHAAGRFAPLCTVAGVPILSLGYALIVWNVVLTPSVFQRGLCSRPALVVGRYSYSLYLWHWYPLMWMGGFAAHRMGQTNVGLGVTFLFLLVVLIGIASLSYRLFEAPYFERSKILV